MRRRAGTLAGPYAFLLIAIVASGCASTSNRLRGGVSGNAVVDMAREAIGTPYRFGGKTAGQGLDCSGLVLWTFKQLGVKLPAGTQALSRQGSRVSKGALMPGDLVFFDISGRGVSHVGIYSGDMKMVHAPSSGGKVREESMAIKYWVSRFLYGRRLD